ncbi:MAG: DNA mismatch repair endonuclease MutL, partial [Candidatus Margulisiibacteriota bacterium]
MNKIHLLDEITINKIAAGEVIERPASIVKELVENSIDAKAKNIKIEIEDGGKRKIAIYDDGIGISKEDLPLALLRHATSKINSLDDIYKTVSMGFRGEALASIRHVAQIKIISSIENQEAYEIEADQEHVSPIKLTSRTCGTSIIVEHLFEKVPVRQKYLRSATTEFSYIYEIVQKMALIYPEKNFTLIQDQKEILNTCGLNSLKDLAILFFGKELKDNLINLDYELNNFQCSGIISNALVNFSNKNKEIIAINKRVIKNNVIQKVISLCFQNLIPSKRFPLAIININISPKLIDVNIHPQKLDLKFLNSSFIFDNLMKILNNALENNHKLKDEIDQNFLNYYQEQEKTKFSNLSLSDQEKLIELHRKENQENTTQTLFDFDQINTTTFDVNQEQIAKFEFFQIFNSFLVINAWNSIWLIDQHAAHERLLFDHLKSQETAALTQLLLVPEIIDFEPHHHEFILKNLTYFKNLGFDLEDFGSNQIMIRALPFYLKDIKL